MRKELVLINVKVQQLAGIFVKIYVKRGVVDA